MFRFLVVGLPVCLGAILYFGQTGGYSRTVDRTPGEVKMALANSTSRDSQARPALTRLLQAACVRFIADIARQTA